MKKTIQESSRPSGAPDRCVHGHEPPRARPARFVRDRGGRPHVPVTTPQLRIGSIEQREQNWNGSAAVLNDNLSSFDQLVEARGLAQGSERGLQCPAPINPVRTLALLVMKLDYNTRSKSSQTDRELEWRAQTSNRGPFRTVLLRFSCPAYGECGKLGLTRFVRSGAKWPDRPCTANGAHKHSKR